MLAPLAGLTAFRALVPPMTNIQREFVALAGIDIAQLDELAAGTGAVLEQGIYSNLTSGEFPFCPHPAIARAFERVAQAVEQSRFAGRRVFLSRADAPNRRMINEAELAHLLEREGFDIVIPGALTATEQIGLFRDAKLIVGQHGAALTNLLFAPPGADGPDVIELHQDNYPALAFSKICQLKGLRYTAIVSRMVDPGTDRRHESTWEADIELIRDSLRIV